MRVDVLSFDLLQTATKDTALPESVPEITVVLVSSSERPMPTNPEPRPKSRAAPCQLMGGGAAQALN